MCYSIPETQKQGGVPEPQFTETSITLLPRPKICCLLPAEKDSIPTPGTQIRGPKARPTSRTWRLALLPSFSADRCFDFLGVEGFCWMEVGMARLASPRLAWGMGWVGDLASGVGGLRVELVVEREKRSDTAQLLVVPTQQIVPYFGGFYAVPDVL
ncbi:hypothetical protein E6O75_ATG07698 [Venturia nashicola]|uniref:Uncharacterized protein n=1 Tax=Venturia nashicola TaxID=86259 RepID=A0A4Z1PFJ9_9PEZI|nr:hypothetical protein E6O75_ATG07698 [Venturia nashicola]